MNIRSINKKALVLKTVLFSFAFLLSIFSFAQKKDKNLVPNPSFEIKKNKSGGDVKNAPPWIGVGTVDYYTKIEKRDTSRYKGPHSGTCYAGLRFQAEYKEYMYAPLTEALEKGRTYHFQMYIRLLGISTVVIKQLGVYLSDDPFKAGMSFDEEGVVDSTYKKGISGPKWISIQGNYLAHGGEKYIILGNFSAHMKDDFVKKNKWDIFEFKEAYYYIDDVSLFKIVTAADATNISNADKNKPMLELPESFTEGQVIELKNLQFEKRTAKLQRTSFRILDDLVKAMNNHPFMEIQINGYTDNTGNESDNKKLSKDRAKAVYDYLTTQGVISPMTYKGMGSLQPVAANDTDENKAKNNRVEVVIIKE
jgi:outer membrane protein OmpA-like peptidoglycan-associated protein